MRAATPTNLKKLRGNPSGRPMNGGEAVVAAPVDLDAPPDFLSKTARNEWSRLGPMLQSIGLLGNIDRNQFAAYCVQFAIWTEAIAHVMTHGFTKVNKTGVVTFSRQYIVSCEAEKRMLTLAAEFGMTPSSRSKIHLVNPNKPKDVFESYLDGDTANASG